MSSVLRPWMENLTWCKQGVLLGAIRGCDGVTSEGPHKTLTRAIRIECLRSGKLSGSFNAQPPTSGEVLKAVDELCDKFWDQLPIHYLTHLYQAAEVLYFSHPSSESSRMWGAVYSCIVKALHLNKETPDQYNVRLGDDPVAIISKENLGDYYDATDSEQNTVQKPMQTTQRRQHKPASGKPQAAKARLANGRTHTGRQS